MTLENIIEKIKDKSEVINDSLWYVNPKDLRSSYSELLGEIVEDCENKKIPTHEEDPYGNNKSYNQALDTAISIINSKLPKEDKNI